MKFILLILSNVLLTFIVKAQDIETYNSLEIKVDSFSFQGDFKIKQSSVCSLVGILNDSIKLRQKYTGEKGIESMSFRQSLKRYYGVSEKFLKSLKSLVFCRYYPPNDETGIHFYELHFKTSRGAKAFFGYLQNRKKKPGMDYPWTTLVYAALSDERIFYVQDYLDSEQDSMTGIISLIEKHININDSFYK